MRGCVLALLLVAALAATAVAVRVSPEVLQLSKCGAAGVLTLHNDGSAALAGTAAAVAPAPCWLKVANGGSFSAEPNGTATVGYSVDCSCIPAGQHSLSAEIAFDSDSKGYKRVAVPVSLKCDVYPVALATVLVNGRQHAQNASVRAPVNDISITASKSLVNSSEETAFKFLQVSGPTVPFVKSDEATIRFEGGIQEAGVYVFVLRASVGERSSEQTVTVTVAAPALMLARVHLKIMAPFDSFNRRFQDETKTKFIGQLAAICNVTDNRIVGLELSPGSVNIDFNVLPQANDPVEAIVDRIAAVPQEEILARLRYAVIEFGVKEIEATDPSMTVPALEEDVRSTQISSRITGTQSIVVAGVAVGSIFIALFAIGGLVVWIVRKKFPPNKSKFQTAQARAEARLRNLASSSPSPPPGEPSATGDEEAPVFRPSIAKFQATKEGPAGSHQPAAEAPSIKLLPPGLMRSDDDAAEGGVPRPPSASGGVPNPPSLRGAPQPAPASNHTSPQRAPDADAPRSAINILSKLGDYDDEPTLPVPRPVAAPARPPSAGAAAAGQAAQQQAGPGQQRVQMYLPMPQLTPQQYAALQAGQEQVIDIPNPVRPARPPLPGLPPTAPAADGTVQRLIIRPRVLPARGPPSRRRRPSAAPSEQAPSAARRQRSKPRRLPRRSALPRLPLPWSRTPPPPPGQRPWHRHQRPRRRRHRRRPGPAPAPPSAPAPAPAAPVAPAPAAPVAPALATVAKAAAGPAGAAGAAGGLASKLEGGPTEAELPLEEAEISLEELQEIARRLDDVAPPPAGPAPGPAPTGPAPPPS
eukprot:tig00000865_g5073.t1